MSELKTDNIKKSVWLAQNKACEILGIKLRTLKEYCYRSKFIYKIKKVKNKNVFYVLRDSNFESLIKKDEDFTVSANNPKYSEASAWAKAQADKYIELLEVTQGKKGNELFDFVSKWNILYPEKKTCYSSIIKMRQRYKKSGINGLLCRKGGTPHTTVCDKYFEYFKSLYLIESAPSSRTCWDSTLGYAMRTDNITREQFPSHSSFLRRLEKEVPVRYINKARGGHSYYNRTSLKYIERDYSTIECGKVWVSDHAQIDVAVFDNEGNVVFPWVTAWRDYKSGKWLGWVLECGSPNSDRIFQAFYYAADEFGLPTDVIIDNGKDYRCKDFAGGRQKEELIKINTNKAKTLSMLDELNVNVHFALPYNAQTKPIERDFLKIKELLSKHCKGYRGGNVVERPEKLKKEIKNGKLFDFETFKTIFDDFILNIFNKKPSQGKNLKGLCPDELFNNEYKERICCTHEALKLFCTRISRNFTVGRNGIKDKKLELTYWADWMITKMGLKVYLRRDPKNYKEAWVFRADNEEFVGKATVVKAVAALHAGEISKEEFKEAISAKKRCLKTTEEYLGNLQDIPFEEQCENYKVAYGKVIKKANPKVTKIANTNMDKAIRKNKEMESEGKYDLSLFIPEEKPEEELFLYETDRYVKQAMKGVANG